MISSFLQLIPIGAYAPLRRAVVSRPRQSLLRKISVALLQPAMRAYRGRLGALSEVRPLDMPELSFEPTDSMVIDSVHWFGVRGYEGILADVWINLCRKATGVLEVGGNIGLFTVLGARVCTGKYTVVEPIAENVRVIHANLKRNRISLCDVIEAAAIPANARSDIELNIPDEGRDAPVGAHLLTGSEVQERSSARVIKVAGIPFRELMSGCDVIKIDAEGIEQVLIESVYADLVAKRPTLVVEVLPESKHLAATLARLARDADYRISVVPAYGGYSVTEISPDAFESSVPARYNSKDVVLSIEPVQL